MELFHFARAASTLARITSLMNARSKLRAMLARSQASRARGDEPRRKNRRSKLSEITLAGQDENEAFSPLGVHS
jgi:hypothetical protein